MSANIQIKQLGSGLTVILENLPHLHSFSYSFVIPGGLVADPVEQQGASLILAELISRGAEGLSSKELSDSFDAAGISHSENVNEEYFRLSGSCLDQEAATALHLLAKMVLEPTLPASEIEPIRSVLLQELDGLADNPSRRAFQEFDRHYYPEPYNRSSYGNVEGLKNCNLEILKNEWTSKFKPAGSILSIAGNFDSENVMDIIEQLFSSWVGQTVVAPAISSFPKPSYFHIAEESAQVQIVMGFPSAKFNSPDYYIAKVANEVLSGGFCGRLFTEVREKRGLCYSVNASHSSTLNYGLITAYAGTTSERAQETLDVILKVLDNFKGSISEEELSRSKANLLTGLIISQESARARASANSTDFYHGKRLRSLAEIKEKVQSVSIPEIDHYLASYPHNNYSLVTLGAKKLSPNKTF